SIKSGFACTNSGTIGPNANPTATVPELAVMYFMEVAAEKVVSRTDRDRQDASDLCPLCSMSPSRCLWRDNAESLQLSQHRAASGALLWLSTSLTFSRSSLLLSSLRSF